MEGRMTIYFYSPREATYGCFSNFSRHGIEMDGVWWPTVEHYFQAQKFAGMPYAERIQRAATPRQAAQLGRSRSVPLRADWEEVKDNIMLAAVQRKFETHEALRALLLATGDEEIVENARKDSYWGCGAAGSGRNQLGKTLMIVRARLRHSGEC
jgi:N-glycosidase YbiA